MLAFFRRALSSWLAVGLLALIMIAFIATGVGTPGGGLASGPGSDAVATVGGKPVLVNTISQRAQNALREARQQQPALTMSQFLGAIGGLNPIVEQYIGATVLSVWAERHGLAASERLIGGEIASVPAFRGNTGQFDQNAMNAILSQRRMTFATLHDDIRDDLIRRQLLSPIMAGARAPDGLLRAYAQLVIDRREGVIGLVPAKPDGIAAPTEQEISDYYKGHIAHYSLPERRSLRYALIGPESVTGATPTEAEIAAQYKADAAKYAASETRTIQRVVLPDENAAKAFSAKVAGGKAFVLAATEQGLAAADISVGAVTKDAFAGTDGGAIADAAFALPSGGTTAPVKSALGWTSAHVEAIANVPARSLAQAHEEISAALAKKKGDDALATLVGQVQDAINDGASFNEIAGKHKLQAIATPPLLPNGTAPSDPNYKADATVTPLLKAAGDATADDEPTVEPIDQKGHFALLSVANVVPAAPVPLAQIKPRVAQEIVFQRAADRAHATAQALLAKINGGQPALLAFAGAGIAAPQPIALTQLDLSRAGANVPAPIRTLFRLAPGKSDLIQGPNGGWFVVRLDRITPGDPKALPMVIGATRGELQRSLGDEYAQQFANAARDEVTVKRNAGALAKLEQDLRAAAASKAVSGGEEQDAGAVYSLAAGRPALVWRRQLADTETPVAAALKLIEPARGDFLLESVEDGATRGRYSLLGLAPDLVFRANGAKAEINRDWLLDRETFTEIAGGPLQALRALVAECRAEVPDGLPPALACLVGYFAYETVGLVETLPRPAPNPLDLPDMLFVRPTLILVFDRLADALFLVAPVWPGNPEPQQAVARAVERIEAAAAQLAGAVPPARRDPGELALPVATPQLAPGRYGEMVAAAKAYIAAGDIFQVVLAQRFTTPFPLPPFDLYRALRRINPSPFLYHLDLPGFALTGSSPEILVRVRDGEVTIRPIAGTRPRGATAAEDTANRDALLADPKERAEHLMLLDLGRNDVGRVAERGTVAVTDSYTVEKYSHVMHIVSNVVGRLAPDKDALDALFAGFPAGTVSGAPKVRACEIIAELEPETRGAYAGGVGYFSPDGSMDSCIVLRTAVVKDGVMHVQAGAGIVADSDPVSEQKECEAKAGALFAAAREAIERAGEAGFGQ